MKLCKAKACTQVTGTFVVLQNLLFYIILVLHLFSFWQFLCKQVINWLVVWFLHIRLAIKLYHDQYVFICTFFFFLAFGNQKNCCDTLWYNWLFLCSIYGFRTIYYQSWWHQLAPMRIFSGRRYQNMIALVKILPTILRHKNNCCCKSRFNSLFYCFLFSFTECDVLPNRIGWTGEYVMNQIWHLYSYNC